MNGKIRAYISLGGNAGNEAELFSRAVKSLEEWGDVTLSALSALYATEPQGDAAQPWFVNQVAALDCCPALGPGLLLERMLRLEETLGRVRNPGRRFGPRAIDLDLLLFGDIVCREEGLILPHPRMTERAFVLVPLSEIAPHLRLPDGRTLSACLGNLRYRVSEHSIFQEATAYGQSS